MKRVMILGGSGSGKSTLARLLGEKTGLPVYHMDHIHWRPGWQARPTDERRVMALDVESRDAWSFAGRFSTTYANRAMRADTLIWLDLPVGVRLWRVTKRLVSYWGAQRPDMAEGCYEGFHKETLPFYQFIWRTRHSARLKISAMIETAPKTLSVVHLKTPAEVRDWLRTLIVNVS